MSLGLHLSYIVRRGTGKASGQLVSHFLAILGPSSVDITAAEQQLVKSFPAENGRHLPWRRVDG